MKKFFAVVLAVAAFGITSVQAEDQKNFGKVELEFNDVDGNGDNVNQVNFQLGREVAPGIKLDGRVETTRSTDHAILNDRIEIGATYSLGWFNIRGAVGERFDDNNDFSYYAIEPGVRFDLNKEWAIISSYRYRDAFENDKTEETHRVKFGAEYSLSKTTYLEVSAARSWGDAQFNTFQVGYGFKF